MKRTLLCAAAFSGCFVGAALAAQRPIEEIVVTGEFRDTRINQVPTSLSVITERQIKARNAQHLEELLGMAPNVNFASGASRGRFYQIRGIGERGQFVEPLNASVGLIVDNVDLSGIGTVGTLYDVGQVEVFRGPQGTLYGANALAGLVNITSNLPSSEFEAGARLEAGNYSTYSLGGYFSGPATETLGYRLALQQYRSDGWVDNKYLNEDDTNELEETTARGRLRWRYALRQPWPR
jgi:outer membrane receptor protein involved in Fe transport